MDTHIEDTTSQAPAYVQDPELSPLEPAPAAVPLGPGLPEIFPLSTEPQEPIREDALSLPEVEFFPCQHEDLPAPADDSGSRAHFGDDTNVSSVHVDSAGPYRFRVDGDPAPAASLQEPASSFPEPSPRSFPAFGSAQAPFPRFRSIGQVQAAGEQSDSTCSSAAVHRSSRNHQPSAIVVGVSGNTALDRGALVGLLKALLPNVREVLHQDEFRVESQHGVFGAGGDTKEHETGVEYKFDMPRLRRVLKTLRSDPGAAVRLLDREQAPSSSCAIPDGVDEEDLKTRLRSETQILQNTPVVIVEGPSLYHLKALRKMVDVRICLLDGTGLSWALMRGTLYLDDEGIRGRRDRDKADGLETVVWRNSWRNDNMEGQERQYNERIFETIALWTLRLVADAVKAKGNLAESRDKDDGRYQICDCGDGLIGRMRRWVVDRL